MSAVFCRGNDVHRVGVIVARKLPYPRGSGGDAAQVQVTGDAGEAVKPGPARGLEGQRIHLLLKSLRPSPFSGLGKKDIGNDSMLADFTVTVNPKARQQATPAS